MTVCIVDDNPIVSAQLKRLLAQAGVRDSLSFTDPRLALKWCVDARPDLILLDYNMPDIDGLQFLGELRRHEATEGIPVAMISGWAVESMRIAALRAGAIDVIAKPFVAEEVKLKVVNLLQFADQRRAGQHRSAAADLNAAVGDPLLGPAKLLEQPDASVLRLLDRLIGIRGDRSHRSMLRTGYYAATIGASYGLPEQTQALLARAVPLLDIGNWSVPSDVLSRLATHSPEDRHLLDNRPVAAHSILRDYQSPVMKMAAEIALACREHWDGSGVPFGLVGDAIPLSGRIAALADMFEQMTCWRGHRQSALSVEKAMAVIRADEGCQFDPSVVQAFEKALPALILVKDCTPGLPDRDRRQHHGD
jgi:response regulator RpfG family c-di-GMP phosphodiesterase